MRFVLFCLSVAAAAVVERFKEAFMRSFRGGGCGGALSSCGGEAA